MTKEDIIRMALEAEFHPIAGGIVEGNLLRFAALVASAAVRETSAEYRLGWNDGQIAEREACAKLCEEAQSPPDWNSVAILWKECRNKLAEAIRARGQA